MKPWKLSAPDWCFFKEGTDSASYYRALKNMGYEGAEMVAAERQKDALNAGLEIVNISGPGMTDGFNRKENREKLTSEILSLTDQAIRNRIAFIIVFSGNRCGISDEEGVGNCLEAFGGLLEKMRGSGVGLLFEMLNGEDHKDYQADTEWFGLELARQLNDPAFKILYDIYHMRKSGCDPLKNLEDKLPFIGHFHVAGLEGRGFPEEDGAIDYRSFFRSVPEDKFHGYVGMEFLTEHPEHDLALAAKQFRDYWK